MSPSRLNATLPTPPRTCCSTEWEDASTSHTTKLRDEKFDPVTRNRPSLDQSPHVTSVCPLTVSLRWGVHSSKVFFRPSPLHRITPSLHSTASVFAARGRHSAPVTSVCCCLGRLGRLLHSCFCLDKPPLTASMYPSTTSAERLPAVARTASTLVACTLSSASATARRGRLQCKDMHFTLSVEVKEIPLLCWAVCRASLKVGGSFTPINEERERATRIVPVIDARASDER
mmetsp:Transcript_18777/g.47590  ORF Transcript_18777/g.47590 Transcript_18777/m.47590 type:complete len:230 (+) Transcript_18777:762-1451(+)